MGRHSIRNPDSFADCIEMLTSDIVYTQFNFDIISERCFNIAIERDLKVWIHSRLSMEEAIRNIYTNSGIKLKLRNANLLSTEEIHALSIKGAVFGPMDKQAYNQTVEDMYFLGGKHFVFLAGEFDDFFILHDPDSSPYILVEKANFYSSISKDDIQCIVVEEYCERPLNYKEIIKKNLLNEHKLTKILEIPLLNNGVSGLASYKYGLRQYLFYIKEIIDCMSMDKLSFVQRKDIEDFLIFAAEGYNNCTWGYFNLILERGEQLLRKLANEYTSS